MNTIFGKQLGRYVLLEKLGEGGMATVYNAYDSRMERNVALKVILPSRQTSQVFLERFEIEARALAQLSQTNIVKVLDYGEEAGAPFLVMEFIQGGTLKEFLNQPIPYAQAAAILAPIARALDYVHKQKIVHRDVKPSNILINENDQPMLSDFGVIRLLETGEEGDVATGVGIGTPDYMSPEQGMGKNVDFRADIYALGVVFYEMVTGQKPFTADTPMAIVIQHVTGTFPRPSATVKELPKIVEAVMMKAVAKDPQNRYNEMAEFAETLEQLARGEKAQTRQIKKLLRPRKKPRPRPALRTLPVKRLLLAALLLIAVFAVATFALWQQLAPLLPASITQYLPQPQPVQPGPALAQVDSTQTAQPLPTTTPSPEPAREGEPESSPTKAPTRQAQPSPTKNAAPVLQQVQVVLPGTPIPTQLDPISGKDNLRQIALWGIGGVNKVAWSKGQGIVALATSDGIFVYDPVTLERVHFIDTQEWVEMLRFSPDDQSLVAGLRSGKLVGWDINNWRETLLVEYQQADLGGAGKEIPSPVKAITFSNNQRLLAIGYQNGTLALWSLEGSPMKPVFVEQKAHTISDIHFSTDNRYIYAAEDDSSITVWDISTKKITREVKLTSPINTITETANGSYLVLSGGGQTAFLLDPIQERILYSYLNLGAPVTAVGAAPDNSLLAFGLKNGEMKVFALADQEQIKTIQQSLFTLAAHPDPITSLVFSPDSKSIASTSWQDSLKLWDLTKNNEVRALNANLPKIERMTFSPDSKWLVVEDTIGKVRILNTSDGSLVETFDASIPLGEVFSQSGKRLILAQEAANHWDIGQLLVIDYPSANVIKTLTGYRGGWGVRFSPDEQVLVSGSMQSAYIWDMATWEKISINGGTKMACGEYYSPDKERIFTVWNHSILFIHNDSVDTLCTTQPDFATPLELINDTEGAVYQLTNGQIWVWNLKESSMTEARNDVRFSRRNAPKDELLTIPNESGLIAIAFEGKSIDVNSTDRGIKWKSAFRPSYSDRGVFQYIAAISADGQILALASQFGTIALWTGQ